MARRGAGVHEKLFGEGKTKKEREAHRAAFNADPNRVQMTDAAAKKFRDDSARRASQIEFSQTAGPGDPELPDGPEDVALPFFRELARLRVNRGIRKGAGRGRGFLSLERNQPSGGGVTQR